MPPHGPAGAPDWRGRWTTGPSCSPGPRRDRHSPTIGLLLCAGRNDNVVRYSLAGTTAPLAVASYTYESPDRVRELVPTDEQLGTAVAARTAPWNVDAGLQQQSGRPSTTVRHDGQQQHLR